MEFIKFPSFHTTVRTVRYATVQTNLNEEKQIRAPPSQAAVFWQPFDHSLYLTGGNPYGFDV